MPIVSITRLHLRSWRYLPFFVFRSLQSARQAAAAEGNLATTLLRDQKLTFWTRTIWSSESAIKSFMHSGSHGKVMKKLLNWCDEAALVHWSQETIALPTWEEAHRRLQQEGRRSKVNHPSAAHEAFVIAVPMPRPNNESRLK